MPTYRWVTGAIFGSPRNRYREGDVEWGKELTAETSPFVRQDLVDPGKGIVPLTLFPGGEHPLHINVTFDLTPMEAGVGWHR